MTVTRVKYLRKGVAVRVRGCFKIARKVNNARAAEEAWKEFEPS